jgi:hypothetical protein
MVCSENPQAFEGDRDPFMDSEVTLLYRENLDTSELNVMKIAKFLGGTIKLVQLTGEALVNEESLKNLVSADGCLITSAQTLSEASNQKQSALGWRRLLMSSASKILVYGFEATPNHNLILQELTSGGFLGVEALRPGASEFRVGQDSRKICRQFTGLSFGTADPYTDFTFTGGADQSQYSVLIRIGQRPFFVCEKDQDQQLMLLACKKITDLDAPVPNDTAILQFFSSLVPIMMFISSTSSNRFWHNDSPRACFIIDDPLLKRRYGFLEYRRLLEVMERKRFCTSIAFIPWNYRRSNRRVTELLAASPSRYSLSVHGCDHTAGEFGSTNLLLLREKAQKALNRMMLHQQLCGLPFDDVMVFPQGIFSTVALKELKSCGYLAAVNSTPYPVDVEDNHLALRELLDVAVTRFSNFPVFIRRYPKTLAELALDLFLGKPALVVEHHGYFRDGYDALVEIVEKLSALDGRLEWARLGEICSRTCLKRLAENGDIHVKFYTDRFWLRNNADYPQNYLLFRQQLPEEPLKGVTIDGRHVDYNQGVDVLKVPLCLDAGQEVEIQVRSGKFDEPAMSFPRARIHNGRVFVRRLLSEFRDNYMGKSGYLSRMASSTQNLFARGK